jgi:hypothetical protein
MLVQHVHLCYKMQLTEKKIIGFQCVDIIHYGLFIA